MAQNMARNNQEQTGIAVEPGQGQTGAGNKQTQKQTRMAVEPWQKQTKVAVGSSKEQTSAAVEPGQDWQETAQARANKGTRASYIGIALNTVLCIAKMVIGFLSGSLSIVADAVNNLSDAASNIISLLGFKLASKPADADHPYGHGRYEYLSGLMVAVLILVIGVELFKGSFEKIFVPTPVEFSIALVVVLVLSIAVKLWMMFFNKRVGKEIGSSALEAAAVDSRNDCITTAAVLAAALVSHVSGVNLDACMGLIVSAFILWSGVGLIRETVDPLLGKPASAQLVEHIAQRVESYDGVLGYHDLMVHDYGPGRVFASLHVEVPAEKNVLESHELIDKIEHDFKKEEGLELVIHLDPVVTSDPRVAQMRSAVASIVQGIDERLSIHDFRMVPGEARTNLIFDCVLPYDFALSEEEAKRAISDKVAAKYPGYQCVINIDRSFVLAVE